MTGQHPGPPSPNKNEVIAAIELLKQMRDRAEAHGNDALDDIELTDLAHAVAAAKGVNAGPIGLQRADQLDLRIRERLEHRGTEPVTYEEIGRYAIPLISRLEAALGNWPAESPVGRQSRPSITMRISDKNPDKPSPPH